MSDKYIVFLNGEKFTEFKDREAAYGYAEILLDEVILTDPDSIVTVSGVPENEAPDDRPPQDPA